jgi:hypothetical protein
MAMFFKKVTWKISLSKFRKNLAWRSTAVPITLRTREKPRQQSENPDRPSEVNISRPPKDAEHHYIDAPAYLMDKK